MNDYEKTAYWKLVLEFVEELKTAKYWLHPDGKPLPEWKLHEAKSWNTAWNAAWNAARNAARNAAGHAARNAAWNAARNAAWNAARDAAGDAAWNAAWNAAGHAAGNAAGNAAWDAAGDAEVFARMLVCLDLPMDAKHLTHLNARMEVWRKGYALRCDVNGILYVYAKKETEPENTKKYPSCTAVRGLWCSKHCVIHKKVPL